MIGKSDYQAINKYLNQQISEKKKLIAVHRGSSAGNIIENTIPAYVAALKMGGDILEADVVLSKDREMFHFHSGMERKNFQRDIDIQQYTSNEIEHLTYINDNLEETNYPVEKLEDTLNYFKGKCLINIDRAWDFFPEVCQLVEKTGTTKQIILKGPLNQQVISFLQENPTKFMFMPKVSTLAELDQVLAIDGINIVAVEIKAETTNSDFFQSDNIMKIKAEKLLVWINALTMNDTKKLFAGYDDNLSIVKAESDGWGTILNKGADIIQTDWPSLLKDYREKWLEDQCNS
ncbi:glycerophosphodiester phosphodiesterase family protein [Amphibacillus sp. Q70]|uniref:glycerophosphodiester phosphodiesterase family protein n=1 Tax=Amphibacillus sp. Q70 TaxID=3453416 RepID=UPI003F871C33